MHFLIPGIGFVDLVIIIIIIKVASQRGEPVRGLNNSLAHWLLYETSYSVMQLLCRFVISVIEYYSYLIILMPVNFFSRRKL